MPLELVHPRDLPKRGLGTPEGRAAFVHAIAHIEFNAIDLAWDAVYRFRGLPREFYADWVGVARDEARHFLDQYMIRHMGPSDEGVVLTRQLIDLYAEDVPGTLFDPVVSLYTQLVTGPAWAPFPSALAWMKQTPMRNREWWHRWPGA